MKGVCFVCDLGVGGFVMADNAQQAAANAVGMFGLRDTITVREFLLGDAVTIKAEECK